jgi:hypothetical protein
MRTLLCSSSAVGGKISNTLQRWYLIRTRYAAYRILLLNCRYSVFRNKCTLIVDLTLFFLIFFSFFPSPSLYFFFLYVSFSITVLLTLFACFTVLQKTQSVQWPVYLLRGLGLIPDTGIKLFTSSHFQNKFSSSLSSTWGTSSVHEATGAQSWQLNFYFLLRLRICGTVPPTSHNSEWDA